MPAYCLSFHHFAISLSPLVARWPSHGCRGRQELHSPFSRLLVFIVDAAFLSSRVLQFSAIFFGLFADLPSFTRQNIYSRAFLLPILTSVICCSMWFYFCGIDGMCRVWAGIFPKYNRWQNTMGNISNRKYSPQWTRRVNIPNTRRHTIFALCLLICISNKGRMGRQCTHAMIKMMTPSIGFGESVCMWRIACHYFSRFSLSLCLSFAATTDAMYFALCQTPWPKHTTDRPTNPTNDMTVLCFKYIILWK